MKKLIELYLKVFHFWMRFNQKIRFLLVGGYNTVFSYVLYALFLYCFETQVQLSLFLSYALTSVHNYLTQKFFVFNTRGSYVKEYLKCVVVWALSYALNAALLGALTHVFEINPYAAQVLAQIVVIMFNYVFLKYFAFQSINRASFQKIKQLFTHGRQAG